MARKSTLLTFILLSFAIQAFGNLDHHFKTDITALNVVSVAVDFIAQKRGWKKGDAKISYIDVRDARIGHNIEYEFDIDVGSSVIPIKFSEEIPAWKYLHELPEKKLDVAENVNSTAMVEVPKLDRESALPPFQIAGPVELWIQDADQLRLALPNDVDAGVLKRIVLADGAAITVTGAREVSLPRPLPLPNLDDSMNSLSALAAGVRRVLRGNENSMLSLRIVGPTSLVAIKETDAESAGNKLKVKRVAPGAIELVSGPKFSGPNFYDPSADSVEEHSSSIWPLLSLNMSDPKVLALQNMLLSSLGPKAYEKGSFDLLRAKASTASFVQVEFEIEKDLTSEELNLWPEWATKPKAQRLQFELVAKLQGRTLLPVSVKQLEPLIPTRPVMHIDMTANSSMTKQPPILPSISPLTL